MNTLSNLIDQYLLAKEFSSANTLPSMVRQIDRRFGRSRLDRIDSDFVLRATRQLMSEMKPGSAKRYLTQLKAVLNWGYNYGHLASVPRFEMPTVHDIRTTYLTKDELEAALRVVFREHLWAYVPLNILAYTGVRLNEGIRLTTACIDRANAKIVLCRSTHKTKTISRTLPMSDLLCQRIESRWNPYDREELFLSAQGFPINPVSAAKLYGLALKQSLSKSGCHKEVRLHDLRHTFAALVANVGGDLADIGAMLGHSNTQTTMRYRGLVHERATRLINSI